MIYRVRKPGQAWYGESIGILILDASYPCVPGNVGNASTFSFPVRYEKVQGASIDRLLNKQDPELATPFIQAARNLRDHGVKAITGACGFMAFFQQEVAAGIDIPVFLSSLLQIPFIHQITGKKVGIITANASCLTPKHFQATGIPQSLPMVIAGMENQTEFREAVLEEKGSLDSSKIEQEVVQVAKKLVASNPDVGAILLECSDDFFTMINYVHTACVRLPFQGFM
jgi:aspartate/glutamate racemase